MWSLRRILLLVVSAHLIRAQQVTGITAGVNQQTGERPSRLDINELSSKGGPAWDLFLQALAAVEDAPEADLVSWYQIAGIHGLPFKSYNGVGQVSGGNDQAGYCPHGQITFITWHRPYLVLLEQAIHTQAQRIAAGYSGSAAATYQAAAQTLRLPYWDWASDPGAQMPPVAIQETVQVNAASGPVTMHNPLYSYQFKTFPFTDPDFQDQPLSQFSESKRCTDGSEGSAGVVRWDVIAERLGSSAARIRRETYAAFTQGPSFADMASTGGRGASLENPHNTVHQEIGCGPLSTVAHMKPVAWSAFDPIFWLHHANVDRHFAMWQAIYPENATFSHSASGQAHFGTAAGPVTADSPLKPFVNGQGQFWTSKSAESTRAFGYTYPGIDDWAKSREELRSQVKALVNTLYGPQTTTARRHRRRVAGGLGVRQGISNSSAATEFSVQIQVDRADLAPFLPCAIEVSVGGVVAGEYTLLSMPTAGIGGAKVPLPPTAAGGGNGTVEGVPELDAVKALVQRMSLVIRKGNGEGTVPVAKVPSLVVAVEGREVKQPASENEFPVYGPSRTFPVQVQDIAKE
ncbi:hypothetical protein B0T18DRAFT_323937 [Schizothecium vesticola]|uniref:Tyrosinase copper-binding domain-containing protein n=1 Tax=Schizothecium vesticola TaxID=314040 RepID=A0AA40K892_9PEZI|nr:hypothetical protein B0T18DRAFT_323937 [Schizothecium vesticola]